MAKILFVDDDENLCELAARFLRQADHLVTTALNGKEAMRLVQHDSFDLVITDLVMPEQEGIETIMELRRRLPALKIIAISGSSSLAPNNYLALAGHLGAAHTLAKPFSGKQLLAAVDRVLSQ